VFFLDLSLSLKLVRDWVTNFGERISLDLVLNRLRNSDIFEGVRYCGAKLIYLGGLEE
jgi:hypothetical protein